SAAGSDRAPARPCASPSPRFPSWTRRECDDRTPSGGFEYSGRSCLFSLSRHGLTGHPRSLFRIKSRMPRLAAEHDAEQTSLLDHLGHDARADGAAALADREAEL